MMEWRSAFVIRERSRGIAMRDPKATQRDPTTPLCCTHDDHFFANEVLAKT